jgi:hypothetical protein
VDLHHHFDEDPDAVPESTYRPDADSDFYLMRNRIRLFSLMRNRIRIQIPAAK